MRVEKDDLDEIIEIETNNYHIVHDLENTTIRLQGGLRLESTKEYVPIMQMFDQLIDQEPPLITLHLRDLSFINSSGINILHKFILKVEQKKTSQLVVQASQRHAWQHKVLMSLQRVMPLMQFSWE
jgi:hypothetical protein